MAFGTSHYKIGPSAWYGAILFVIFIINTPLALAQTVPLASNAALKNSPTGIVRAMAILDQSIFLAAENGVYKLTGASAQRIPLDSQPGAQRGIISDLALGAHQDIYIIEFGVGIHRYDVRTGEIRLLALPSPQARDAWQATYLDDKLYVAVLSGFLVIDTASETIVQSVNAVDGMALKQVYDVTAAQHDQVVFTERSRLIFLNTQTQAIETRDIATHYPNLSSVTALTSQHSLYIGGPEGLYIENDPSGAATFYGYAEPPLETHAIRRVFVQQNGKAWVAADGLYEVSPEQQQLVKPGYLRPMLSSYAINTVIDLNETPGGELLVASTQQGLLVLPPAYDGLQFLHTNSGYFHQSRIELLAAHNRQTLASPALITTAGIFTLDIANGKLTEIAHSAIPTGPPPRRKCWLIMMQLELTDSARNACGQDGAHITAYGDNTYLLYTTSKEQGAYLVIQSDGVVDRMIAPDDLVATLQLQSGALVALDVFGQLHVQMSRFNWRAIPAEDIGAYIINCMIERQPDILWLCTSGNGMVEINLTTMNIRPVALPGSPALRFIRSAVQDNQGNVWLATNRGVVVVNPERQRLFTLGQEDGIPDVDFHYNGMYLVGDTLVLAGDKYGYVLNTEKMLAALQRQAEMRYAVKFLSLTSGAGDNRQTRFAEGYDGQRVSLSDARGPLSLTIAPANYTYRSRQRVAYRIQGVMPDWQVSDNPYARLTLTDLRRPFYRIEARVIDGRSVAEQPVSAIQVHMMPPAYFSWQAYLVYSVGLFVLGCGINKQYQTRLRSQMSQVNAEMHEQKEELASSQKSIRHLMERKQQLFTNISHEIKTPLALIIGILRQVAFDKNDEKQVSQREIIFRNAERVECLVDQIVEIEKLDSVRDLPKRQYNVHATADAVVQSFAGLIEQKALDVSLRVHGKRTAYLLEDSLEQILTNLLGNAIKYTAQDGHIHISIYGDETELKIRVKDDGIGIDEQHKKIIFERFTRIEEMEGAKGIGVGLALINEIVKANGGWIEVESERGKGSCFIVYVPQKPLSIPGYRCDPEEDLISEPEASATEPALTELSVKHRVLVVEDDRDYRSYLYTMLSAYFSCFTARNGRTAIDVFNTITPHLVVTDFRMPDIDGIALARYIRTQSAAPQTPIILLTAHTSTDTQRQRFSTVVDCMLGKSMREHDLIAHIRNLINLRELTEQHLTHYLTQQPPVAEVQEPVPHFALEKDQAFYTSLQTVLEKNYADAAFNRTAAAKALNMSERQLNRRMADLYEHNFAEQLKRFRIQKARVLLCSGHQVTATAMDVGFCTASYFSHCFKAVTGLSPSAFQQAHRQNEGAGGAS